MSEGSEGSLVQVDISHVDGDVPGYAGSAAVAKDMRVCPSAREQNSLVANLKMVVTRCTDLGNDSSVFRASATSASRIVSLMLGRARYSMKVSVGF